MSNSFKPFGFEYDHDGGQWTFTILAASFEDAEQRLAAIKTTAAMVGQQMAVIPAEDERATTEYGLKMPFWIDTDGYSDRDREMFVCGVEFEMVRLELQTGLAVSRTIHRENESRVRMMCGRLRRACTVEPLDGFDEWSQLTVEENQKP